MKKLLLVFFCFFTIIYSRDPYEICEKIKKIDPNASQLEYRELARDIKKKHLTTCKCLNVLMRKKYTKWIENNSDKNLDKFNLPLIQYASLIDNGFKLGSIKIENDLPNHTFDQVNQIFKNIENTGSDIITEFYITIKKGNETGSIAAAQITQCNLEEIHATIFLANNFFDELENQQQAVLYHEIWHIFRQHQLCYEKSDFYKQYPDQYYKLRRIQEREADLCSVGCCTDLISIEGHETWCKKRNDCFQKSYIKCLEDHMKKNPTNKRNFDPKEIYYYNMGKQHPTDESRYLWAKKILKLREAEEYIKKPWFQRSFK